MPSNMATLQTLPSSSSSSSASTPFHAMPPQSFDEIPLPGNVSRHTKYLDLSNSGLTRLPTWLAKFQCLEKLNISKNQLRFTEHDLEVLLRCSPNLKILVAHTNLIRQIPKTLERPLFEHHWKGLEQLDLSNNRIENITSFTYCESLAMLQLSANKIQMVPREIRRLQKLELLYLGHNQIEHVGSSICSLSNLQLLALNNNKLEALPASLANLHKLRTLHLHYNQIMTIPTAIVQARCRSGQSCTLREITLRGNPLVTRFVRRRLMQGIRHKPPSLYELACRSVKVNNVHYDNTILSERIIDHLESAHKCPNPVCPGVYFDTRYVQVKFVDCCGAYQLPLQQFLCSPNCMEESESGTSSSTNTSDSELAQGDIDHMYRRVILTGVES